MEIQKAKVEKVYPCKIWAEKDFFGTVRIKMHHQAPELKLKPFTFIEMHYDHLYTSNGHQAQLTQEILKLLGAEENKE